jgi:hypothetical protein
LAGLSTPADAGCGCDKPPPPRAAVRPFVAYPNLRITLFDDRLVEGTRYDVRFESTTDGSVDWSRGTAATRLDLADRALRRQLRVNLPDIGLGPCRVSVHANGRQAPALYTLTDDQLTVTARPVTLHDFRQTVSQPGYRAGVGRDGTLYIPLDVGKVDGGTRFTGTAIGLPVTFGAENVAMYNTQGFLMQLLDPSVPGLFSLYAGSAELSDTLSYWRHEFRTYREQHRVDDDFATPDDEEWHANGTPHIDHDQIVLAIRAQLPDGSPLAAGPTPPFQLAIFSEVEEH